MKTRLIYVELKTGFNDNGPAWIGMGSFSKTGRSIYFNGLKFSKGIHHNGGNHIESLTGLAYWISGIKRNGADRHWAGGGKIQIDKNVTDEYLSLTKLSKPPGDRYEIIELNNEPPLDEFNILENRKLN